MHRLRECYVTVTVVLASLVIAALPRSASWFEFRHAAVVGGAWWRVFSGHLTHFGWEHAAWDIGVFAVLGMLCEYRGRRATLACLGLASACIPLAIAWGSPTLEIYRGLSGLDTALFALLGTTLLADKWREGNRPGMLLFAGLLAGMAGKIAWEFLTDRTMFVDHGEANFVPVPLAHLVGAAVGLLVGIAASAKPLAQQLLPDGGQFLRRLPGTERHQHALPGGRSQTSPP